MHPQKGWKAGKLPKPSRPFYQAAIYAATFAERKIPMGARILFEELVRACGRRAFTWISQGDLADRLGVSVRTIQRYEKALASGGLVTLARVSLWARWKSGGSRRLAIPHVCADGALVCPAGVLDDATNLLEGEGVSERAGVIREQRGVATWVSRQWRKLTSLKTKRNHDGALRPVPPPKTRTKIAGGLEVDGVLDLDEIAWRRAYRLQCIAYAKGLGYA